MQSLEFHCPVGVFLASPAKLRNILLCRADC